MNDYLSTLAARSLGLAPVATPRLTSWFEPASPAGGTTAAPPGPAVQSVPDLLLRVAAAPVEGNTPRARDTPRAPMPQVAVPSLRASGAGHSDSDMRRSREIQVIREPDAHALPPRDLVAAARVAQESPVAPAAKTPASQSSLTACAAHDPEGRTGGRSGHQQAPPMPSLDDIVRRLTDDRLTAVQRARGRDSVRMQPAAETRVHTPTPARPPTTREPSTVRRAVRESSDAAAAAPEAPAVRITIGRIEVRAVMPDSPGPLPKPVPPSNSNAISLDEYLKQRSGAGP